VNVLSHQIAQKCYMTKIKPKSFTTIRKDALIIACLCFCVLYSYMPNLLYTPTGLTL